jgi:hypothetical protein
MDCLRLGPLAFGTRGVHRLEQHLKRRWPERLGLRD